jgi:hypothetical protein
MSDLCLAVKRKYFDEIKSGKKHEEFRLRNDYWKRRLEGRRYDTVTITLGYPKRDDTERRMTFAWAGYVVKTITHEHFDNQPVEVFAIGLGDQQ